MSSASWLFESLASKLLQWMEAACADYIQPLDPDSNISIWHGEIRLMNIRLKPTALASLGLPLLVERGEISQIHIKVPWLANLRRLGIGGEKTTVHVSGLDLVVRLQQWSHQGQTARLQQRRSEWIAQRDGVAQQATCSVEKQSDRGGGWGAWFAKKLVDSLQLVMGQVNLQLIDVDAWLGVELESVEASNLGYLPLSCGLTGAHPKKLALRGCRILCAPKDTGLESAGHLVLGPVDADLWCAEGREHWEALLELNRVECYLNMLQLRPILAVVHNIQLFQARTRLLELDLFGNLCSNKSWWSHSLSHQLADIMYSKISQWRLNMLRHSLAAISRDPLAFEHVAAAVGRCGSWSWGREQGVSCGARDLFFKVMTQALCPRCLILLR
eukprot:TRINITY_DN19847_c0_g3_i2.p1 TRINITY_DN19847_c0_g3~~TRINITY_DN19847_c0_g3_i2.p1  ORF type:complete len:386 (+),score=53.29 TRINITY_DN19847_c0_g3_i2:47-1204(+)